MAGSPFMWGNLAGKLSRSATTQPPSDLQESVRAALNVLDDYHIFASGTELFFNKLDYDQCVSPFKQLVTQSVLASNNITNAQAVSNLPMQGWRKDGTFGYLDHNLCTYSENFSVWTGNTRRTRRQNTTRWVIAKTLSSTSEVANSANITNHALGPKISVLIKIRAGTTTTADVGFYNATDGVWNTATSLVVVSGSATVASTINNLTRITGLSSTEDTVLAILGIAVPASKVGYVSIYPGTYQSTTIGDSVEVTYCAAFYGSAVLDYVPNHSNAAVYGPPLAYNRGAVSNYLENSGDLSQSSWTKAGSATAAAGAARSNGVTMSLISVGLIGTNHVQSNVTASPLATNGRYELGFWIEKVTNTGRLSIQNNENSASGVWAIDLSMLPSGVPVWVTRNHPAVTVTTEFKSHSGSATASGVRIGTPTETVQVYIAALIDIGTTAPAAYLATGATAPLHTAGTPTRQNLLTYSSGFDNAIWSKNRYGNWNAVTVTANAGTDPLGGSTAALVSVPSAGSHGVFQLFACQPGVTYTFSVYVKNVDHNSTIYVGSSSSGPGTLTESAVTLTSAWTRVSASITTSATQTSLYVGLESQISSTGTSFYMWGAQLNEGPSALTYVPTTASTGAISEYPLQALVPSPAVTNLILDNCNLTTANWTLRGATTRTAATDSQIGAYTQLRSLGASGVDDVFQTYGYGIGNAANYEPALLMRRVSTSGSINIQPAGGATGSWLVNLALLRPGWNRVDRNHPAVTISTEFATSGGGVGGVLFCASSGSLDIDVAQINAQSGRYCGPLVLTAGAQRTLSAVTVQWPAPKGAHAKAFTLAARCVLPYTSSGAQTNIVYRTAGNGQTMLYHNSGTTSITSYDGTNSVSTPGNTITQGAVFTVALAKEGSTQRSTEQRQNSISTNTWTTELQGTGDWLLGNPGNGPCGEIYAIRIGPYAADPSELMRIAKHLS